MKEAPPTKRPAGLGTCGVPPKGAARSTFIMSFNSDEILCMPKQSSEVAAAHPSNFRSIRQPLKNYRCDRVHVRVLNSKTVQPSDKVMVMTMRPKCDRVQLNMTAAADWSIHSETWSTHSRAPTRRTRRERRPHYARCGRSGLATSTAIKTTHVDLSASGASRPSAHACVRESAAPIACARRGRPPSVDHSAMDAGWCRVPSSREPPSTMRGEAR